MPIITLPDGKNLDFPKKARFIIQKFLKESKRGLKKQFQSRQLWFLKNIHFEGNGL